MFLLYNFLLTILAPLWVPWMLFNSKKRKEAPNWKERTGEPAVPERGAKRRIWFHTVSVGEFVAATPILKELRKQLPNHEIVVSVTTSSGHKTARENGNGLYDYLIYFPIDVLRFQMAAIQRVRPDVVVVMETELWMNFLYAARTFRAKTILVNGRISDRAYPKSLKIKAYYRALFKNLNLCLMQSKTDVERIRSLGAKKAKMIGNCKFDQAIEGLDANRYEWEDKLGIDRDKPTVVVGSTRGAEEEKFVLDALESIGFERFNVVHAPRHLERVDALAEQVKKRAGKVALISKGEKGSYLILDTYGELSHVYSVADVVIVGGGFAKLGGQNIIQPLALGKPVLHGVNMQNFKDVAAIAEAAGASISCTNEIELGNAVRRLLQDLDLRERMGDSAREVVLSNSGASAKYAKFIAAEAAKAK